MAGHETTTNLLGNGLLTLLRHHEALAQLRADPQLMPGAVDEMLRFESSVNMVARHVAAPYAIGDTVVPSGDLVFFMTGAANRDPAVFAEPDRFDITRSPNPHLALGAGIHYCVGAPLARSAAAGDGQFWVHSTGLTRWKPRRDRRRLLAITASASRGCCAAA